MIVVERYLEGQVNHLSTEDGLSQGMVYSMLQDRDGFIWVGTKDGLNRYDGTRFKVFTNDPEEPRSISGNTVTLLYEDSKGRIWAASQNSGLNIYDKRTGAFRHIKDRKRFFRAENMASRSGF